MSAAPARSASGQHRDRKTSVSGYLAPPLLVALAIGWLRPGRTHDWSLALSMPYWIIAVGLCWLLTDLCTRFVQQLASRMTLPLWLLLVLGSTLSAIPTYMVMTTYVGAFQSAAVPEALQKPLPVIEPLAMFDSLGIGMFIWTFVNLAMVQLGFPRFGYAKEEPVGDGIAAGIATPGGEEPAFFHRLDKPVGELEAICAEEHYLRVFGSAGSTLIRYRISDAVRELQATIPGARVHRSWWVSRDSVVDVDKARGGMSLRLRSGLEVPVSRTYRDRAIMAGLIPE